MAFASELDTSFQLFAAGSTFQIKKDLSAELFSVASALERFSLDIFHGTMRILTTRLLCYRSMEE